MTRCRITLRALLSMTILALPLAAEQTTQSSSQPGAKATRPDAQTKVAGANLGQKVLLVVNSKSWASLTIANEYVKLRNIPQSNILCIPFELARKDDTADIDTFRQKILSPVLKHIADNKLAVDYIVYSSDFPTAIDFGKENKYDPENKDDNHGHRKWPAGSINGLTFLHEAVMAGDVEGYLDPHSNLYFRQPKATDRKDDEGKTIYEPLQPRAFSSRDAFEPAAKSATSPASRHYYISTVLGLTSGRGNSVREVIDCLRRAAAADGTNPRGTCYYMYDDGIRTKTRYWGFASAVESLQSIGQKGELIRYVMPKDLAQVVAMPRDKDDIIGAMLGQQFPNCVRSNSKTLPGAIVENLTSEGGIMNWGGGQVPISEFIRFGAAGTAGTVMEPTALQWKFPDPFLFYYYSRGATLGEAFYQSVSGPYQLLIVGDPLCRPFTAEHAENAEKTEKITAENAESTEAAEKAKRGELASDLKEVVWSKKVALKASVPGAKKIEIVHLGRVVSEISGDKGPAELDASALGMGSARLYARAQVGDRLVMSDPLTVEVKAPEALKTAVTYPLELSSGAIMEGFGSTIVVTDMRKRNPLVESKISAWEDFSIHGFVEAPSEDAYQFQVWYDGPIGITIDGHLLAEFNIPPPASGPVQFNEDGSKTVAGWPPLPGEKVWHFIPVSLSKGTHDLSIHGMASESREIDIRFGGPGSRSLGEKNCRYYSSATRPAATGTHPSP